VCEARLSLVDATDVEPGPDNTVSPRHPDTSVSHTELTAPDVKPDHVTRKYYEVRLL